MEKLWESGEGVISTQVLEEFYMTVTAKIPNPLKFGEARQIISDLGTWKVAVLEIADILTASEITERFRLSFWDGLILASAHKEEAVWSEDFKHGQKYGEITVYNHLNSSRRTLDSKSSNFLSISSVTSGPQ